MDALPERCVPCKAGGTPMDRETATLHMEHVPEWTLDFPRLRRRYQLATFGAALDWVNRVAELAEREGHHPDVHLTDWNRVELVLWTHAVGGLHVNDFVLAGMIDALWGS